MLRLFYWNLDQAWSSWLKSFPQNFIRGAVQATGNRPRESLEINEKGENTAQNTNDVVGINFEKLYDSARWTA